MTHRGAAVLVATWLLFGTSGCSGGAEFQPAPGGAGSGNTGGNGNIGGGGSGGTGSGEAGAKNEAGSKASGGSSVSQAGSSTGGKSMGGTSSTGGTSNPDQPDCATDFDALDRSCERAEDCALVDHQVDCCGTMLVMGLASIARTAFNALEQYCSAQFPACGCAARGTQLEDGSIIDFGVDGARVSCVDGRCRSNNAQQTTACGDKACTADQYCYQFVGGPAGSEPSYSCEPLGDCQDCACLRVTACSCSGSGSQIKVFCAAP